MSDVTYGFNDVDSAATDYARGLTSQRDELKMELDLNGGTAVFPALFDLEGNLVPAKYIETRYGMTFALLGKDNEFTGFFSPSKAKSDVRRVAADEAKGYYVGSVRVPAAVGSESNGGRGFSGLTGAYYVIYRTDRGFSADAEIVDNGK